MSESEALGLKKLTEYLNQTRRQAEMAIDNLTAQVNDLNKENKEALILAEKFEAERDYYRNYAEQLKLENSKKWKLQERDDWKGLLDTVTKDRNRLQGECQLLESSLDQANKRIKELEEIIASRSNNGNVVGTNERVGLSIHVPSTPSEKKSSNSNESSPRSMSRALQLELQSAHEEMEQQRRKMDDEKRLHLETIRKLKYELQVVRSSSQLLGSINTDTSQGNKVAQPLSIISTDLSSWLSPNVILHLLFPPKGSKCVLHV